MTYSSILKIKPKKENKIEFCRRIVSWLNDLPLYFDGKYYSDNGIEVLNILFRYSNINNGFSSISDLLYESGTGYGDIFDLSEQFGEDIDFKAILANIDIICNCIYCFKKTSNMYFYDMDKTENIITIMMKAIEEFLLCNGYKTQLNEKDDRICIIENNIGVNITNINDENVKSEVLNFYDYKNTNDLTEKRKIIVNLAQNLEGKKKTINELFGNNISSIIGNYVNNFNLRHDNVTQNQKNYHEKIASLSDMEILEWWDYIFAFLVNIYVSVEKLKDVNINNGYK